MKALVHCSLLVAVLFLFGCQKRTWTSSSFPWQEAPPEGKQEEFNHALRQAVPYVGSIYIVHPAKQKNAQGKPSKRKTEIQLRAFLRDNPGQKILSESVWVDAHDISVLQRMGDSKETKIVLRDSADGELFEIRLHFDPNANTLRIQHLSNHVKKKSTRQTEGHSHKNLGLAKRARVSPHRLPCFLCNGIVTNWPLAFRGIRC